MKTLVIPFLERIDQYTPADDIVVALAPLKTTKLREVPWTAFPYRPSVQFRIAHTIDSVLLLYEVKEKHIKAEYRNTNDPVYKDSCVEFFISFDGTNYYNLEFNCLGTGLIGYGPVHKAGRERLPNETIERIKTYSSIKAKESASGDTEWQLLLNIPIAVFGKHAADGLAGVRCTGNFYKCGDELPEPHFVAWNGIDHPTPNFHLPQYFGELIFQ